MQAEAEVVPSSSLVEVEVEVRVEMRMRLGLRLRYGLSYFFEWLGWSGWISLK